MQKIRLFHHPQCERCRKIAACHRKLDWLHRLDIATDEPPCGPLQKGEIAVQDLATGETVQGVAAVRRIFRHIPAYAPLLPLLYLPPVARKIDNDLQACHGTSCDLAPEG